MSLSLETQMTLKQYMNDKHILTMQKYNQHAGLSTYDHCLHVTIVSLLIATFFKLSDMRIKNIIIGAMLHDYFLYDWHNGRITKDGWHCWSHPKIALYNAKEHFSLNKQQRNIIRSHMFPATLFHIPLCREAWIVSLADKICAIQEYMWFTHKHNTKMLEKYIII